LFPLCYLNLGNIIFCINQFFNYLVQLSLKAPTINFQNLPQMSDWLEHTVQVEVPVSIQQVWNLWSDLEQMPLWMKWIDSVEVLKDNPELSRWQLASGAFKFSWLSRIVNVVPEQIIQWESVDGLPNKGAIRFYDRGSSSIVKLSVAYAIPGILGKIMDDLFLGKIVESTLKADMERFRVYAETKCSEGIGNRE
jgi:uncharacterized membrane protein